MNKQVNSFPKIKPTVKRISNESNRSFSRAFLLMVLIALSAGCVSYYDRSYFRANSITSTETSLAEELRELRSQFKFFIVYLDGEAWQLTRVNVNEENTELRGKITGLPTERFIHLGSEPGKLKTYNREEKWILDEVHIYVSKYSKTEESNVIIPISGIARVDVFKPARGATLIRRSLPIIVTLLSTTIYYAIRLNQSR